MTAISQPFDKACFVRSEYNQFYFGEQIALFSKTDVVSASPNIISITPSNISSRGYRYLEKGYSPQYLLLVLQNGSSYEALPIYGPKVDGVPSLRYKSGSFASISTPSYSAPRACTKNKDAIAQCNEVGGLCILRFEAYETENGEL